MTTLDPEQVTEATRAVLVNNPFLKYADAEAMGRRIVAQEALAAKVTMFKGTDVSAGEDDLVAIEGSGFVGEAAAAIAGDEYYSVDAKRERAAAFTRHRLAEEAKAPTLAEAAATKVR